MCSKQLRTRGNPIEFCWSPKPDPDLHSGTWPSGLFPSLRDFLHGVTPPGGARIRADARSRDGRLRKELEEVAMDTLERFPLVWCDTCE
jgi:hypothetical protein